MKYCPDCGKELGAGVVKCWNPDCRAEFVVPVDAESSDPPIKKSDDLRQLESEYQLATHGLAARAPKAYAGMIIGFLIFLAAAFLLCCSRRAGNSCFPAGRSFGYSALLRLPY
jgi:hypothetical protein